MTIKVVLRGSSVSALSEIDQLVTDRVASRIFAKDSTLWGKDAEQESAIRLGWVDAANNSLELVPEIKILRDTLLAEGLNRIVLCGMGGSSLAPEVITATHGKKLVVLDSTDPGQVLAAISDEIESTVVVVSSKSGSTVETDSQKRAFEEAFSRAGIDKTSRIVIVTDPDSPMENAALADGYRVFRADPTVGGRYSALTAFGLVPSMLAGVEMESVLHSAISAAKDLAQDHSSNPALLLGAAMARSISTKGYKDKLGFVPEGSKNIGFGDWLEQLIAESTGKTERGVLPVVLDENSPELVADHDDLVLIGLAEDADLSERDVAVSGELGEQLILWEVATAVASRLLGVNPFDQPDVESAKIAARAFLENPKQERAISFDESGVSITSNGLALDASLGLELAIESIRQVIEPDSYLSIQAYLDRLAHSEAINLRNLFAARFDRPTTFGWGPRFLHSTGQYHKGGPRQGVFIQILSGSTETLAIPGREFSFRQLLDSQSGGDAKVLASLGRPVLSIRFRDVPKGIQMLASLLS